MKSQISDMMLLICEDEKPIGFFESQVKEGDDVELSEDKNKGKLKDKKEVSKANHKEKETDKVKVKGKT